MMETGLFDKHGLAVEMTYVQTNTALGLGPWSATSCSAGLVFVDLCWTSTQPRYVTVTWPDGRTESFGPYEANRVHTLRSGS